MLVHPSAFALALISAKQKSKMIKIFIAWLFLC